MNAINSTALLDFTLAAALKVRSLIEEEGNFRLNLRVFITGGGCSGFQYGFTFDENINPDDFVIEKQLTSEEDEEDEEDDEEDGGEGGEGGEGGSTGGAACVKLLVDPMSFQYLQGAKIDYREDVKGSEFVISNPNAKTTCGCGSSFSA